MSEAERICPVFEAFSGWNGVFGAAVRDLERFFGWGATTVYPTKVKPQYGRCVGEVEF